MNRKLKIIGILTVLSIALSLGLKYLSPLFAPFLLGIFFACLIEPMVGWLEVKLNLKRKYATITVLSLLVLVMITLIGLMVAFTYQELQRLVTGIPFWVRRFSLFSDRVLQWGKPLFPEMHQNFIKLYFNPELIGRILRSLLSGILDFLPQFPQIFATVFLGAVSAFFFSRDKQIFSKLVQNWLPRTWYRRLERLKCDAMNEMGRFVRIQLILVLITVVLTMGTLSLNQISGAWAYSFLAGCLDFIPVLGPGLIYIPLSIGCFLMGNYVGVAGILFSYFLVLFIRQVAEMKLLGENLNLHPLVTMVVAYLGTKFFGVMGLFSGPLLIIALRSCYRLLAQNEIFDI